MQIVEAAPDRVVGHLPLGQHHSNGRDRVHGGAIMAFADTLGAIGTVLNLPQGKRTALPGRRAQLEKMFELRRYGPDKVAKAIMSSVRKNKPIRPVTPEAYLLYGTSRILPQALRSTARGRVV